MLHINHRIHKLIINGNNNNIEINPLGNASRIILKGINNKIISNYSKVLTISDSGFDNTIINNTSEANEDSDTSDLEIPPQRYVINTDEEFIVSDTEESEEDSNNNNIEQQNLVFNIINSVNLLFEMKKEEYLNNLIDIYFKKEEINKDNDNNKCPICYEYFEENEQVKMTSCFHVFHFICIKKWIETKFESPDCPICRRKL